MLGLIMGLGLGLGLVLQLGFELGLGLGYHWDTAGLRVKMLCFCSPNPVARLKLN